MWMTNPCFSFKRLLLMVCFLPVGFLEGFWVVGGFCKRVVKSERVAMGEEGLLLQQQQEVSKPKRLSCIPKVDALWFCYSPVYQMTEYYREGTFDNCRSKWTELFDCISLKAKPADQVQAILEERGRKKPHIWEFRTPEEATKHWKEEFGHLQD